MEFISSEHCGVWKILNRSNYTTTEASDIEQMYNVMVVMRDIHGDKMMQFLSLYASIYGKEMAEVADKLKR